MKFDKIKDLFTMKRTERVFPVVNLLTFIGVIYALTLGAAWYWWALSFVVYALTMGFGISATYHRLLAHKSYKTNKFIRNLGIFFGGIGGTGSAFAWVAVHRTHHRFSDKPGDPHDARVIPMWQQLTLAYGFDWKKFTVRDYANDKFIIFQHEWYFLILIVWGAILFAISPMLFLFGFVVPVWFQIWATSSSLILEHKFGYRTYETKDKAMNNWFNAWTVWGEGWHNNHHHNPGNAKFGEKWWEVDLGYLFVKLVRQK